MSRLPISNIEISPNENMVELSKQISKTIVFSFPKEQQRYDMTVSEHCKPYMGLASSKASLKAGGLSEHQSSTDLVNFQSSNQGQPTEGDRVL
jgi:hypothetical protein